MTRLTMRITAAALFLVCTALHAQTYPGKPIKLVVPFPPGGATDILARVLAEKMAPKLGQPIIVDNKAGAAGIIGTEAVAKAPPDGYTMVLGLSNSMLTNVFLYEKLPYDPRKDLEPLTNNRRAFAQAAWRHLLFGVVLAELERRLNDETEFEPLERVPISSNGHGNIEHAAVGASES